jgi:hypothetical protein
LNNPNDSIIPDTPQDVPLVWAAIGNGYRAESNGIRYEVWRIGKYWMWCHRQRNPRGYWIEIKRSDVVVIDVDEAVRRCSL